MTLFLTAAPPSAAQAPAPPPARAPQLAGLDAARAQALLGQLASLQARLRNGEPVTFTLLAGAPASYPMTNVAPRAAFLGLRLQSAFSIARVPSDNPLWQPYRLVFAPDGPGRLIWNVEVVLGATGAVERVTMIYEPPAPF